jgi:hypothetical protein
MMPIRVHHYVKHDGFYEVCKYCGMVRNRDRCYPQYCPGKLPMIETREPQPMSPIPADALDQANQRVTEAVFEAERALDSAIVAYRRLVSAEAAVVEVASGSMELEVAASGHGRAEVTLSVLLSLRTLRTDYL